MRDGCKPSGQDDYDLVIAALEVLQDEGPMLGRPLVDTLVGSRHRNMKELRPGSRGRSEVRILFAFDPRRRAIMLTAGDKSRNWQRWYRTNIPIADERFDQHLEKAEKEENMTSLDQMKRRRPVRRGVVNAHKDRMLAETRAWRLRELRERFDLTQVQLARQLDVSQNRVSRIEQGEIDKTQVDTLRRYVEALGGSLNVEVHLGDDTFKIA